jgi:hypothetical protein
MLIEYRPNKKHRKQSNNISGNGKTKSTPLSLYGVTKDLNTDAPVLTNQSILRRLGRRQSIMPFVTTSTDALPDIYL